MTPAPSRHDLIAALESQPYYDRLRAIPSGVSNQIFAVIEDMAQAMAEAADELCALQSSVEVIGKTYDGVKVLAPAVPSKNFTREEVRSAIEKARAALAAEPEPQPVAGGPVWPNGCLKPQSCGRHRACMYAQKPESCEHFDRDIEGEVLAAGSRGAASPHPAKEPKP